MLSVERGGPYRRLGPQSHAVDRRLPHLDSVAIASVVVLIGLGLLPASEPVWDTSSVLADDSIVGGFLAGLVGYRARPTALETIIPSYLDRFRLGGGGV